MRVEASIRIERPAEVVWRLVVDHANDPSWCSKVKAVNRTGELRWDVVHKPIPLRAPVHLALEQLEARPPSFLKLREEDELSTFEVTYRLAPLEQGTRFTQTSEFEWKKVPGYLRKPLACGVRRDVRRQLRALKRVLEAG